MERLAQRAAATHRSRWTLQWQPTVLLRLKLPWAGNKVATVLRAYTYLGQTKRNDDDFINIITDADAPLEYRSKQLHRHATQDSQYHYLTLLLRQRSNPVILFRQLISIYLPTPSSERKTISITTYRSVVAMPPR